MFCRGVILALWKMDGGKGELHVSLKIDLLGSIAASVQLFLLSGSSDFCQSL